MKKVLILLFLILLLGSCGKEPPAQTTAVTTTETTLPETTLPIETIAPEITAAPSVIEEIEALPADTEHALLTGAPVGGNPRFFVFEDDLTYYVRRYYDAANLDIVSYYKCELSLPSGYTDGEIIAVRAGAGSGEVILTVSANKDGESTYLDYLFYSDNLADPVYIWVGETTPIRP